MLCSAIFKDGVIGRNLDWLYSEMADCVIKTPTTIGVAGANSKFTKAFANSNIYTSTYEILPFYLQDGLNRNGLFCCTLVVPNIVEKSIPSREFKDTVCSTMLVRYIIDKFKSIDEAFNYLHDNVEIYHPDKLLEMGYNQHWLLAEADHAAVMEINSEGELVLVNQTTDRLCVTNFHLYNAVINTDGTVYTPNTQTATADAIQTNKIHPYGSGLERYNLLQKAVISPPGAAITNIYDMKILMKNLRYSQAYTEKAAANAFYTEFVELGSPPLTCASSVTDFEKIRKPIMDDYRYRSRDPESKYYGYWSTNHSAVYDLNNSKIYITGQETYNQWIEDTI